VLRRTIECSYRPVQGAFDSSHLKAIHHYLFQDVYEWAGKFRTVNMGRSGQIVFAHFGQIEPYLANVFQQLATEKHLRGCDLEEFVKRAAYYLGEINAVHPFREGNGRSQREFIRQLAERAGFEVSWQRVERTRLYEASEISFVRGDNGPLSNLLRGALTVKS
jgi:cell filamentation protein